MPVDGQVKTVGVYFQQIGIADAKLDTPVQCGIAFSSECQMLFEQIDTEDMRAVESPRQPGGNFTGATADIDYPCVARQLIPVV